jgi:hypothetical protein
LAIAAVLGAEQKGRAWPPDLEVLVDQVSVIIQGKVTKVEANAALRDQQKFDAAVVRVTAVLKWPEQLRDIRVMQPAARGSQDIWTDLRLSPGQERIWLLDKDVKEDCYWVKEPEQVQPAKQKDARVKVVGERARLPGGKAVEGLVARAELQEWPYSIGGRRIGHNDYYTYMVRFSLKNVSHKPIRLCDYSGSRPLHVDWTGPDGKLTSRHYAWLDQADLKPLDEESFVTLLPGGVWFIDKYGLFSASCVSFSATQQRGAILAPLGKHRVTVSYVNEEDGKRFGLKDVWTGTVTANEVSFTFK